MKNNTQAEVTATAPPRPRLALLANVFTVLLLVTIPLLGLSAVWTLTPWNRRAKIIVTVLFAFPAVYPPYLVIRSLVEQAF